MLNFNSIKMKNIITLLLCLTFVIGSAQDKDTKKADELYERMAYADAADAYLKLLKRGKGSRYVFEQLGYCYYQINDLTQEFIQARDAQDFGQLIRAHESAIAEVLNLIPVKQELFPDFKGEIKSLGGWGGDFMLALGPKSSPDYFKAKGFPTVISFADMVR
ncbi:MAG: hypothetical protein EBY38_07875 [Flavobacteriaceae bacterium]|nr:hypothetical protein [Flavobacteriaceae bacterium]